ncbi:MAG: ergothioneine biosynthesis protein EgtB [Burkholderiaceae bacterium]|jgi:ergothioneine biosynthesis protein EgtB
MTENVARRFAETRRQTENLTRPLSEEDMTIQAAAFASPAKWHLAHTSWFFEEFVLHSAANYRLFDENFRFLFNSYYETLGRRQPQSLRGLITRPGLSEVMNYRQHVTAAVLKLLDAGVDEAVASVLELGVQHEQQHQELFVTDILFNLSQNPLYPVYLPADPVASPQLDTERAWRSYAGGLFRMGHAGDGFAFDNECPQHRVFVEPFTLASHLVTNREWLAFIEDGAYQKPLLWLADGWKTVQADSWTMPLHWVERAGEYRRYGLNGLQALELDAPVMHISYFEANAFARWAGCRLPTEAEWEFAMRAEELPQAFGEVWQWTSSAYGAYPGFRQSQGALNEYNSKFMNGQYVLRGSSFATPAGHARTTYRNFFYPDQRWQFTGLRLANQLN